MTLAAELGRQARSGARWTSASSAIGAAAELLQFAVLARLLGPEQIGLMAMALLMIELALAYTDLGVGAAIVQRRDATREQLSSLYWLNLLAGIAVFAVVWLAAPWVARGFARPELEALVRAVAFVLLIVPVGKQFELLLQKELAFRTIAWMESAGSVLGTIAAIAAALDGRGVWSLVVGALVAAAVRAALFAWIGLRRFRPTLRFRTADLRGYLGFGLYQMGEQTVNVAAHRLDQVVIGGMLGASALGLYNLAASVTSLPLSRLNPIVTRIAFPVFARVQDDRALLRRGYLRLTELLAAVNAPLLAGLAAVAPTLVPLVFGEQWRASVPLVQLMAVVGLSRSIGNPIGSLLLARGRADLGFRWNVGMLVVTLPAVVLGARLGGVIGVAAALLALQLALQGVAYVVLVREMLGPCGREYALAPLPAALLAGAMALVVAPIPLAVAAPPVVTLALQVAAGAAVYVAGLRLVQRWTFDELLAFAIPRADGPSAQRVA